MRASARLSSLYALLAVLCSAAPAFWWHRAGALETEEDCVPPEGLAIEFMWGFNRESVEAYREYSDNMRSGDMVTLFSRINERYPGSRFGVFHFGDATQQVSTCYDLWIGLTSDLTAIQSVLDETGHEVKYGGSSPERVFQACIVASADEAVGWTKTARNDKGQKVVRVLAISSDDKSSYSPSAVYNWDTQTKCGENDPTISTTGSRLSEKGIIFMGLIYGDARYADWKQYDTFLSIHATTHISELDVRLDSTTVIKNILEHVTQAVCTTTTTAAPTTPRKTTTAATTTTTQPPPTQPPPTQAPPTQPPPTQAPPTQPPPTQPPPTQAPPTQAPPTQPPSTEPTTKPQPTAKPQPSPKPSTTSTSSTTTTTKGGGGGGGSAVPAVASASAGVILAAAAGAGAYYKFRSSPSAGDLAEEVFEGDEDLHEQHDREAVAGVSPQHFA